MTGPEGGPNGTRPISVAELLAKNGTIGAPPVGGGRRRRRRGNNDSVTVAELTGEIPIVRTGEIPVYDDETVETVETDDTAEPVEADDESDAAQETAEPAVTTQANGNGSTPEAPAPQRRVIPERAPEPLPRRGRTGTPERSHYPRPVRNSERAAPDRPQRDRGEGAELMSPDPIDLDESDIELDLTPDDALADGSDIAPDELGIGDASYLHSSGGALFGGETVADDLVRRGGRAANEIEIEALDSDDLDDDLADDSDRPLSRGQLVVHGIWIVAQSIVAVAFGAGLFIAFDQLWKWNSIVALVLGVLVILGLVVGVRIVRKTEDIGSTLTAVAVGALVTFGPLALLQAN